MSRWIAWIACGLFCLPRGASAGLPPQGTSACVLSPTLFPGWQAQNACYPFVVRDDNGTYRMYYTGSGSEQWNDSVSDQWVTGMVTSSDTLNWKRPDNYEQTLFARRFMEGDLVDPDEISNTHDSMHASGACVLKDGSTYKVWYTGWNGQIDHIGGGICHRINFRVGYATSPDGNKWTKVRGAAGAGSVLGLGAPGDQDAKGAAHPHVLKINGQYRMWYEGYDGTTWRLFYASSSDGIAWTKQGLALGTGNSGALDEKGLRNPMVLQRKSKYELWYQGQSTQTPNYHVLRATSDDGLTWTKSSTEIVLHPSQPVSGNQSILVDSAIVLPDNTVQVFFAKQVADSSNPPLQRFYIYTEVVNP